MRPLPIPWVLPFFLKWRHIINVKHFWYESLEFSYWRTLTKIQYVLNGIFLLYISRLMYWCDIWSEDSGDLSTVRHWATQFLLNYLSLVSLVAGLLYGNPGHTGYLRQCNEVKEIIDRHLIRCVIQKPRTENPSQLLYLNSKFTTSSYTNIAI